MVVLAPVAKLRRVYYGWWMVTASYPLLTYLTGATAMSLGLLFDPLKKEFGWSVKSIALVASFQRLEGGILNPLVGFFIDRFGGRKLMLVGQLFMGGGLIFASQVQELWHFYLAFVIVSVGASLGFFSTITAMLVRWFDHQRGLVMGLTATAAALGSTVVPVVAFMITRLGWRDALFYLGIGVFVFGIPLALVMRDHPSHIAERHGKKQAAGTMPAQAASTPQEAGLTVKQALKTRDFWVLALASAVFSFHHSFNQLFFIPYLQDTGFSRELAGTALTMFFLIGLPGRVFFGWLADHLDTRKLYAVCYGLMSAGILLFTQVTAFWHIIFYALTYGLAVGAYISLSNVIIVDCFGVRNFASIRGITQPLAVVAGITGPLFIGAMFDATDTYTTALYILWIPAAIVAPLILTIKKRKAWEPTPTAEPTVIPG
jgi:MFS family permease